MQDYNDIFLKIVKEKLSDDVTISDFLMDTLCIGKQAAYRRQRGDVPLTMKESVLIAKKLEISIDLIMGGNNERVSFFRMCMAEFENPKERDYKILEEYVGIVQASADDPYSQMTVSSCTFPQQIFLQFEHLTQFFLFFKMYHEKSKQAKAYHQIYISDRMKQTFKNSFEAHRQFKTVHFILDKNALLYLINKIKYFYSIKLIKKEDVLLIHKDAVKMLSYLEKTAIAGRYENGSQVYLYISNISLDKNFYNIKINDLHMSIIETYILDGMASVNKIDYDRMEEWILSGRRLSNLISICGESQRIDFFNEQRLLLDDLLNTCG